MALRFRKRMYIPAVASGGVLGVMADGEALPVVDFGVPAESAEASLERVACILDFTSGAFDRYDGAAEAWHYTGGGKITIKGGVEFTDDPTLADVTNGATLLWGTFSQAVITKSTTDTFELRIAIGSFAGANSADMLLFYGVSSNVAYEGGLNLKLTARNNAQCFASEIYVEVREESYVPVALPATFWFCGAGMEMLYPFAHRQRAAV